MWRRFEVTLTGTAVIEFDDELVPDDEWRGKFYNINNVTELAEHLAYNLIINNVTLSELDGFADRSDDMVDLVEPVDAWDIDVFETTDNAPYPKHSEHIK